MNSKLYNEIANTYLFEMEQQALFKHANMFRTHYRELSTEEKNKYPEQPFLLSASTGFREKIYLGRAGSIARWEELDDTDVVINVIKMSGPMMRNGGMCAYGSMELRKMIKEAADIKQCIGQIFIVDTPGGNSYTKFDLKEALDYAHAKGQSTVMYVDGMLASAGMAWGALCQKRYAHNEHCLFGCMGTYACFYTNRNGDVNSITQEMYHEVYATDSSMKNRPYRDAARGEDALIQEEVDKSNKQYRDMILSGIPKVTEEQLKGGMWEAGEVIGTLCDGIRTFEEVVNEMLEEKKINARIEGNSSIDYFNASQSTMRETAQPGNDTNTSQTDEPEEPKEPENPDTPGNPNDPVDPNEPEEPEDEDKKKKQTKNKREMGKKYEKIQAALGLEVLESGKDNSIWLHEYLADAMEAFVAKAEQTEDALSAKVTEVKKLTESIQSLRAEHTTELENAKQEANAENQKTKDALEAEKAELERKLEFMTKERDSLKESLEQKDKEIAELAAKPAPQQQPSSTMQVSKEGFELPSKFNTAKEQRAAKQKLMAELKKRI